MEIKCYRDLIVWQKAMLLVVEIYRITSKLPHNEEYGLKSQIRRAAVSVPSNIAEGHSRQHTKEFLYFLSIALGSNAELETQLELLTCLHLASADDISSGLAQCAEVGKMLHRLVESVRHRLHSPRIPSP